MRVALRYIAMQSFSPLQEAYIETVLRTGRRPASVHAFMQDQGQAEAVFYEAFTSFAHLERSLMTALFQKAVDTLRAAPEYAEYGTREKLLALFFTWTEVMLTQRSLVLFIHERQPAGLTGQGSLRQVAEAFRETAGEILREGRNTGEVADRWVVSRWYRDACWVQARLIFRFWLADQSPAFERTDAIIEKSVNFLMDLIQPNALDSGVDLLRFFVQRNR